MPTPIPNIGQLTQLQKNLSDIIQQGIVGVFILMGIIGVLIAAAIFMVAYSRRNQKPIDTTAGTNAAINAFAEMINSQNKQIEEDRQLRRDENEANRKQIKELHERYIESISANADATNRIADNHDKLIALWNAEIGNKPYQGLIDTVNRIETDVSNISKQLIPASKDMQKREMQDFLDAINDLKKYVSTILVNMQDRISEKRQTGTNKQVPATVTTEGNS